MPTAVWIMLALTNFTLVGVVLLARMKRGMLAVWLAIAASSSAISLGLSTGEGSTGVTAEALFKSFVVVPLLTSGGVLVLWFNICARYVWPSRDATRARYQPKSLDKP